MHDLLPLTALGGTDPALMQVGSVTLRENPDVALASVAARHGKQTLCRAALAKMLGEDAPGPRRASLGSPFDAIWIGPDQWMICAPYATHEDLAATIKARLRQNASVTEQSDAWVCLELVGADTDAVMERVCNLDIAGFGPGDATRTTIDHLGCLVIRRGGDDGLRIFGPRSSAGSLWHTIETAMRSAL